jgi:phosphotransferase system enzyme I (PtsI)
MARNVLSGIPVSPGIGIGEALRVRSSVSEASRVVIPPGMVDAETARLHAAARAVEKDLAGARDAVPPDLPECREIIAAHMLICRDPKLLGGAEARIRGELLNAGRALENSAEALCAAFNAVDDPYLRDRFQDIRAVISRIQSRLCGGESATVVKEGPVALLAEEISPADILGLRAERVSAMVTVEGGQTTHTAILARSLNIPAVMGVEGLLESVGDDEPVIVDAFKGRIYLGPTERELAAFAERREEYARWQESVRRDAHLPAVTLDAVRVTVQANIEGFGECAAALRNGGEGVGLCRTEYAYLKGRTPPEESVLYEEYSAIVASQAPARVIFRTLDLRADEISGQRHRENNPVLGLRSIRWCLRHQDVFRTQLRALLRAGAHGNAALMLPMISCLREVRTSRRIIRETAGELRAEGLPHAPDLPLGIMIEVPSAVMIADALAAEADFFSIGTNDLVHYLLAIDRDNTHVAYLHEPLHPGVIRALQRVIDCAHHGGIPVFVCGILAADPYCLPVLLGMGIDGFSAAPRFVPLIKYLIRKLRVAECAELARRAVSASDAAEANRIVTETLFARLREEVNFHTTVIRAA